MPAKKRTCFPFHEGRSSTSASLAPLRLTSCRCGTAADTENLVVGIGGGCACGVDKEIGVVVETWGQVPDVLHERKPSASPLGRASGSNQYTDIPATISESNLFWPARTTVSRAVRALGSAGVTWRACSTAAPPGTALTPWGASVITRRTRYCSVIRGARKPGNDAG